MNELYKREPGSWPRPGPTSSSPTGPLRLTCSARCVPAPLELDTFDGQPWLGVVAFRLSDIHLHGLPPLPGVRGFPEVNLRTYVRLGNRPGVLFLSLHCANPIGIAIGSLCFRLPYHFAPVQPEAAPERAPGPATPDFACPAFAATYRPLAEPRLSPPDSLQAWLTERYSYFAPGWRRHTLVRCDVAHAPWLVAPADGAHQPQHARLRRRSADRPATRPLRAAHDRPHLRAARGRLQQRWPRASARAHLSPRLARRATSRPPVRVMSAWRSPPAPFRPASLWLAARAIRSPRTRPL